MVQPAEAPDPRNSVPSVRIGNAEREAVVARLQAALSEGRLELNEFEERSSAAYAAKTERDLVPLTADLPADVGLTPKTPAVPSTDEVMELRSRGGLNGPLLGWLRLAIIVLGIWVVVAVGQVTDFWPVYPVGILGVLMLSQQVGRLRHR